MELTDIVFENRNKEYGAYKLRKNYARTIILSFIITILAIGIFVGYSLAYKFYTLKPMSMPKGVLFEPTYLSEEQISPPDLPELKPEENKEPSLDKLNETPVITDSVPKTVKKEEQPRKDKAESEDSTSAGGARPGVANGDIMLGVQRMPEFPGGEKALASFLQKNIRYNVMMRNNKTRGQVILSFIVRRNGRVEDIKIVKSLVADIDIECIRVVSLMPLWMPALSGGRPVDCNFKLPITF